MQLPKADTEAESKTLSATQKKVLDFVKSTLESRGHAPTLREINEHMRWKSTNSARTAVAALERKGYLRRDEGVERGLALSNPAAAPVVSKVETKLRTALKRYNVIAVRDGEVVADLAGELAKAVDT